MTKKITLLLMLLLANIGFSQTLPFDFSSDDQLMAGADGAVVTIVQDNGNDVLQFVGNGGDWDNAQINFSENLDLSNDANNTITFRIKAVNGTGSGNHKLKFEQGTTADTELDYTITGTEWTEVSLDFGAGLGSYERIVLFTDAGGPGGGLSDTYLFDDISGAFHSTPVLPNLPFDFSNDDQLMTGADGAVVTIVQDNGNDVLQVVGNGGDWDNAQINFADNLDLSDDENNTITFRIKAVNGTGSGNHKLKFEQGTTGDTELDYTITGTEWTDVSLDFGPGFGNYARIVLFTDAGGPGRGLSDTYLFDDIAMSGSNGGGDDAYCETVVTHFGNETETATAIKLTVENSSTTTMKVTVESNDADPVDDLVVPAVTGAPLVSAKDESVAGKISVTLTWGAAPNDNIDINILWSKVSFGGNWQLSASTVPVQFDDSCFTASVNDNALLNVSMYPNPTSSKLNISAQSTIKNAAIYNVLGKQIMRLEINKNSESIDVSNLASGIYLIKYTIDNTIGTAKFIKK